MINYFKVSISASDIAQHAAMACAYERSDNEAYAEVQREEVIDSFKKMALELGYTVEKTAAPKLRAAA